jgi:hypothetical protein
LIDLPACGLANCRGLGTNAQEAMLDEVSTAVWTEVMISHQSHAVSHEWNEKSNAVRVKPHSMKLALHRLGAAVHMRDHEVHGDTTLFYGALRDSIQRSMKSN